MRIASRLAFLAFVLAWFILLRPTALGGPAGYEIVAGTSMEPLLHTGDLVITQAQSSYSKGDLIVYRIPAGQQKAGSLIVHRIIGGDADTGFITQGDNKPAPDTWHPKQADVVGRSWVMLPGSGKILLMLRQPLVLAAILGGLAFYLVLTSGSSSPAQRPRRVLLPVGRRTRSTEDTAAQ